MSTSFVSISQTSRRKALVVELTSMRRRPSFAGTLLAGASLLFAADAFAADTTPPVPPAPSQATQAAPPAAGDSQIEEVVVTARRRSESVQDVPVAIAVLTGDDLQSKGLERIEDIQYAVPSTTVNLSNPRQAMVTIRGIGANPASDGTASSVGTYIDGIYLDRPGMAAFDQNDLAQIDVLRGPQGTLFGKNTTAGALNITSNKPSFTYAASGEVTVGNYGTNEYKAMVNGPASDTVAVRLAAYDDNHGGYVDALNGGTFNDLRRSGIKASLLYKPSEDFSLLVRGDYEFQHDNSGLSVLYSPGPATSTSSTYSYTKWIQKAGINPVIDPKAYATDTNVEQFMNTQGEGFSAEANWTLANGYNLTSLTGFRGWMFRPENDNYSTVYTATLGFPSYSSQVSEFDKQASEELRLASPTGGIVDYVAGLYYFWRREDSNSAVTYPINWSTVTGGNAALNGHTATITADPTTNSTAVFGQGNLHFNDQWTLTGGLRQTYEANAATIDQAPLSTGSLGAYKGTVKVQNWNTGELLSLGYKPVSNILDYISFNHGAKAGGFNAPAVPVFNKSTNQFAPVQSLAIEPEVAYSGEIGTKSTFLDRRLTVDVDAFWSRFSNYQANSSVYNGSSWVSVLQNVGAVVTRGSELQLTYRPFKGLSLGASGSYDLAYYQSFSNAPAPAYSSAASQDLSGRPVVGAPRWTGVLNATYTEEISEDIVAYVGGDYAYRTDAYGYAEDTSYGLIKAYGLANFRIGTTFSDRYDFSLWIRNAFNTAYFYNTSNLKQATGYTASPGDPQVFGATLRVKF